MQRNLEVIREILLRVEAIEEVRGIPDLEIGGFSESEVVYNLDLSIQAGLVDGKVVIGADAHYYISGLMALTWVGHDFLDSARDTTLWSKAKREAKNKGLEFGRLPLEVAKRILNDVLNEHLGF